MAKLQQIVGFRVGKENFGVPIGIVHEIVRMMDITVVPDSPAYIEGVINLRGKIIPVVDLRKRFAEEIQPQSPQPHYGCRTRRPPGWTGGRCRQRSDEGES